MDDKHNSLIANAKAALAELEAFEAEMLNAPKPVAPCHVPDALELKMEALFVAKYGPRNGD